MPEGDTVYRQAKLLAGALEGQILVKSDFRVPRFATVDLSGYTVTSSRPRGKHLLLTCEKAGEPTAVVHSQLKMEGIWHIYRNGERWRRPEHTARAILTTPEHQVVGFSLGILEVLSVTEADAALEHLGPDLLGPDWDAEEAQRRIESHPEQPIGVTLLEQRNLAGIGNVFRNEICFLIRVHPRTRTKDAPVARAVELAKRLLEANRERAVRSTLGMPALKSESSWVYGRTRQPCRKCGTRIIESELQSRVIYFCPRCQPMGA